MATLDSTALEYAHSLTVDETPVKMRCANCNKIALDGVKIPCCDSSICLECSQNLQGETCPVCFHSPVAAEDCKPNKGLRTTIAVWVKTALRKRQKDAPAPAATPVLASIEASAPPDAPIAMPSADVTQSREDEADATDGAMNGSVDHAATSALEQDTMDAPVTNGDHNGDAAADAEEGDDEEEDPEDQVVIKTHDDGTEQEQIVEQDNDVSMQEQDNSAVQEQQPNHMEQQQQGFGNFGQQDQQPGFGNSNNMNFGGMNSFNPMMGGMGMGGFNPMGMPNMMGMPGMMDPSMMFGNSVFGGMDMNAMMNMGMGGPAMGMGGFGGGMMGGGGGGFGGQGGNGFNGQNGGYNNQQNFGNNMNQQFRNDRGFGGRPYGRGFGRGRAYGGFNRGRGGGYQNQSFGQQQFGQNQQMQSQSQQQQQDGGVPENAGGPGRRGSPVYEPMSGANPDATQSARDHDGQDQDQDMENTNTTETNPTIADGEEVTQSVENGGAQGGDAAQNGNGAIHDGADGGQLNGDGNIPPQNFGDESMAADGAGFDVPAMHGAPQQDEHLYDGQQPYNDNFGPRGRGGFRGPRGGFRGGRGGFIAMQSEATDPTPTPAPPVNAPSGPKAMREGRPNTGYFARQVPTPSVAPKAATPVAQTPQGEDGRSRAEYRDRDYDDRSRSRSKQRSRKQKYEDDDDGYESEESRRRRKDKERDRKHRDRKDRESKYDEDDDDRSSRKDRSRNESRDEEHSNRRHRDKDEDRRASRSHHERERSRDKRKRRHRSRSPEKAASINGDGDSRRKSKSDRKYEDDELDRIKDRSRRHSRRDDKYDDIETHSHRSSRDEGRRRSDRDNNNKVRSVIEPESDEVGFKIKGSKSASLNPSGMGPPPRRASERHERRESVAVAVMGDPAPQTPTAENANDPYAEERERHLAERVAKEVQRRQGTKRSARDQEEGGGGGGVGAPSGPKRDAERKVRKGRDGRRISVKYEDELPR